MNANHVDPGFIATAWPFKSEKEWTGESLRTMIRAARV
jgi:hypothetical protein